MNNTLYTHMYALYTHISISKLIHVFMYIQNIINRICVHMPIYIFTDNRIWIEVAKGETESERPIRQSAKQDVDDVFNHNVHFVL